MCRLLQIFWMHMFDTRYKHNSSQAAKQSVSQFIISSGSLRPRHFATESLRARWRHAKLCSCKHGRIALQSLNLPDTLKPT